jgi:Cu(I)/Ag(I) efflux system membrane protein CusA/SilA
VPVTTTVEGRNRFTVNVRYAEDFRTSVQRIREVLVPLPAPGGAMSDEGAAAARWATARAAADAGGARQIELGAVADVRIAAGPPMIRDEAGMLVGYVYVDIDASRDVGRYVEDAQARRGGGHPRGEVAHGAGIVPALDGAVRAPGEMEERMKILVPVALMIIVVLLYLQFRNFTEVLIVLLSVPFALVGSVWALFLLGYNLSTAVWVGVIALVGLAAQTGVVMIVYIDHAYERRLRRARSTRSRTSSTRTPRARSSACGPSS